MHKAVVKPPVRHPAVSLENYLLLQPLNTSKPQITASTAPTVNTLQLATLLQQAAQQSKAALTQIHVWLSLLLNTSLAQRLCYTAAHSETN